MSLAGRKAMLSRPTWLAAGLLLALSIVFMGQALFAPQGWGIAGVDTRAQFYPWLSYLRASLSAGRLPFWDPYEFSGYPFLANPQVGLFYPPTWLMIVLPIGLGIAAYLILHLWLAELGMFLFTRELGASAVGAFLAALTLAFNGFSVARITGGHLGLFATSAWIPWVLLAYRWAVKREAVWAMIVAGLPVGAAILAGNISLLLYVGLIGLAFAVYLGLVGERRSVLILALAISGVVGLALSAVQLLPFAQFALSSTHLGSMLDQFGSRWSLPPVHLLTLLNPIYFGGPPQIGYWSVENFTELTYYVGALPLLAIALALRQPTRLTWLYVGLGLVGLLLALGTYAFLYPLVYRFIPIFQLTRAPARAALLFVFGSSALLADTLTAWESSPIEARIRTLAPTMRWLLGIIAGLGFTALAVTGAVFAVYHPSETGGRLWHQADGWAWALIVFLAGGFLLWRYLATPPGSTRLKWGLAAGLAVLVVADLWSFGLQLIGTQPLSPAAFSVDASRIVGQTPQRVVPWAADLEVQNDGDLVGLNSILGYNPLELASYVGFADGIGDPRSKVYDVLGVAYVLAKQPLEDAFMEGSRGLKPIAHTDAVWVYQRPRPQPLARLIYDAQVIEDPAQVLARVEQDDFRPRTMAILQSPAGCSLGPQPDPLGSATVVEHRPEYWRIDTDSSAPGLLVVSEAVYPGWQVTVDGQPAQPLTAYATLRAVCVAAGKHQVEWSFRPTIFLIGGGISLAGLLALGLAAVKLRSLQT